MSIGGGSQKSESSSQTTPTLFKPAEILPNYQRKMQKATTNQLGNEVLYGDAGLSPLERSMMTTRMNENIGDIMDADISNLRDIYAKSGVRGGVQGSDISDIRQAGIKAYGDVSKYAEDANRAERDKKWARLLQMLGYSPPFAASQASTSSGSGSAWKVDPIKLPW